MSLEAYIEDDEPVAWQDRLQGLLEDIRTICDENSPNDAPVAFDCTACGGTGTKEYPDGQCRHCRFNALVLRYFRRNHPGLLRVARENVTDGNG